MQSREITFLCVQDIRRHSGKVERQHVDDIVLDTGCKRIMVHQEMVAPYSIIKRYVVTNRCANRDTDLY